MLERLVMAIRIGATYELSCKAAGISYDTFRDWMLKGETDAHGSIDLGGDSGLVAFSEFSDAVRRAEGEAAAGWLAAIEQAASEGVWQAAAWKLERRYPHDYGRKVNEHVGKDDGPIVYKVVWDDGDNAQA